MPLRYTQRIINHLSHGNYKSSSSESISRDMQIDSEDIEVFQQAIDSLSRDGRVVIDSNGKIQLPSFSTIEEMEGRLKLTPRGVGFLIPDQPFREGDLFIPPGSVGSAISGDRVRAKVFRGASRRMIESGKHPFTGRVIEVIERKQEHFAGVLKKDGRQWVVHPDGRSLHGPVLIRDPGVKGAKPGDKVVFEMLHFPEGNNLAEGVITKVLGEAGRPDIETQAVIAAHGLHTDFSKTVLSEAKEVTRLFDRQSNGPWSDREDITDSFLFTIDPPNAKDFDDAISIEFDDKAKQWTLGVHIADVAHFVTPGSLLNDEAELRGNSVYLPRIVLPMLPEVLSNGVCSLQEGVPRFAKSVFITLNEKGKVLGQRLSATVISSRKRLTYLEAQALIDGNSDEARKQAVTETEYSDELIEALQRCDRLARILRQRRQNHGMIELNLPDVELIFDDDGHVKDVVPEDDAFTHKIIEMFMVEANEAVARVFDDLDVPILRRIHPEPVHGDIEELRLFARVFGLNVPQEPTRQDLRRLLEATRNSPASRAIHFAVLRTLTKATYSPALMGHFALASEHYAHFTSPIRRYPDLTLHRAFQAFLDHTNNGRDVPQGKTRKTLGKQILEDQRVPDESKLMELGRRCSETEDQAERAERELTEFLVLQHLHEHHLGEEFAAVVTGMTSGGIFISIDRFLVEGRVRTRDLPSAGDKSDRWEIDSIAGRAVAQRSGSVLMIGDIVTAQIVAIDLASRHLDLLITKLSDRVTMPAARGNRDTRENKHRRRNKSKKRVAKRSRRR